MEWQQHDKGAARISRRRYGKAALFKRVLLVAGSVAHQTPAPARTCQLGFQHHLEPAVHSLWKFILEGLRTDAHLDLDRAVRQRQLRASRAKPGPTNRPRIH